jgi:hypothetical protein
MQPGLARISLEFPDGLGLSQMTHCSLRPGDRESGLVCYATHGYGRLLMRSISILVVATLGLAGCGTSEADRASGGAATGAGTGAVIGLLGGPVGVGIGALIGAGVGAGTGAAVSPDHVNLGTPPWSDHNP